MTKSEELGKLIGMTKEDVEREIDSGMWDILIELNKKNYLTSVCCEGHLRDDGSWNGYIGFKYPYEFETYPYKFTNIKNRQYYYWSGVGEESRKVFLKNLLIWAKHLPRRELTYVRQYTLYIKSKRSRTGREKMVKCSTNYEDIKVMFNRADMYKYDTRIEERVIKVY